MLLCENSAKNPENRSILAPRGNERRQIATTMNDSTIGTIPTQHIRVSIPMRMTKNAIARPKESKDVPKVPKNEEGNFDL